MKTIEELMNELKRQCDIATPEMFMRRLENTALIFTYVEKRFEERYPKEFAAYSKAKENETSD